MTLRSLMSRVSARTAAVAALAVAVVAIPATLLAWGPDRPTYTIAQPADHVTFNSITDNPNIGDERNFVGIRESGTNGLWQDNQTVVDGKEYVVRMYVHNNAAANLGLVAKDVTASFNLPANTATSIQVQGFLRSSNASPTEVYDHANFTASREFNLAVVPGSIKYYNNANGNGFTIPESVFTNSGAKLGYTQMDGNIPGCFQYAGYLTFIVKPQFAPSNTDFTMKKQVKVTSTSTWSETVKVAPGTKVTYRLDFENTGQTQLNAVVLKDVLPAHVSLVPGTVKIYNGQTPNGSMVADGDKLVTSGINVGAYTGGGANAVVMFDATVDGADKLACGTNTLHNIASATPQGQTPKQDSADVTVDKTCEQPKDITVCRLSDKKYPVTIKESEFDSSKYSKNPADCETPKPTEHCPVPGKENLPKNSPDCKETPATPATPTSATELPHTGIGSALSVLGLGSLTAAVYAYVASHKQN